MGELIKSLEQQRREADAVPDGKHLVEGRWVRLHESGKVVREEDAVGSGSLVYTNGMLIPIAQAEADGLVKGSKPAAAAAPAPKPAVKKPAVKKGPKPADKVGKKPATK